ncbi:hypothetical protein C8Q79DRAFT_720768 [Trametes meyenii]|nr:hypothetical protein C8Q79DRAFT_720768 [Trametes meyenii]
MDGFQLPSCCLGVAECGQRTCACACAALLSAHGDGGPAQGRADLGDRSSLRAAIDARGAEAGMPQLGNLSHHICAHRFDGGQAGRPTDRFPFLARSALFPLGTGGSGQRQPQIEARRQRDPEYTSTTPTLRPRRVWAPVRRRPSLRRASIHTTPLALLTPHSSARTRLAYSMAHALILSQPRPLSSTNRPPHSVFTEGSCSPRTTGPAAGVPSRSCRPWTELDRVPNRLLQPLLLRSHPPAAQAIPHPSIPSQRTVPPPRTQTRAGVSGEDAVGGRRNKPRSAGASAPARTQLRRRPWERASPRTACACACMCGR